jgi:hypothetical protein
MSRDEEMDDWKSVAIVGGQLRVASTAQQVGEVDSRKNKKGVTITRNALLCYC